MRCGDGRRLCVMLVCMKAVAIALFCMAVAARSQKGPTFEVASIKQIDHNKSGLPYHLGPDSLTVEGRIRDFVIMAYDLQFSQVEGGPSWADSAWFQIQAKAPGPSSKAQIHAMLANLLTTDFHVKIRRETRLIAGYALMIDKRGPKLPPPLSDADPDSDGVLQIGQGVWARGTTIQRLARGLWIELQIPVVDETKIQGHYNILLRFDDPESTGAPAAPGGFGSAFTALREFGLKLEARKVPVEFFVIESADRPTEN
jgi:uncharacterized protein (TIGR03435 family)